MADEYPTLENMSAEELAAFVGQLRAGAIAAQRCADALETWWRNRGTDANKS
jgi:hypothetical protein